MLQALLKLSRWQEFIPFTIPLTLLGGLMAYRFADDVALDGRLFLVLIANCLAVGYAFMINDIEDAEDDRHNPERGARNAVTSGEVSARTAWTAALVIALAAAGLYALAGPWAFAVGLLTLALGHFYSWKPVRLKAWPVVDIVSHVLMLSTLLMLAGYMIYDESPAQVWLLIISVTLFSAYGQLYNQTRDFEEDRAAGLHNTASILGQKASQIIGYAAFAGAMLTMLLTIASGAFPFALLGVILITIPIVRLFARGQDMRGDQAADAIGDVQVQLLLVANIALFCWLIYAYLNP